MPDDCMEELSKAIDAMNRKEQIATNHPEVKDLVAVAQTVKKYGQLEAESLIICRLGDVISADLSSRRRRKRLISAFSGIAAAALLFVFASHQAPLPVNEQPPLANTLNGSRFAQSEVAKPDKKTAESNDNLSVASNGVPSTAQPTAKSDSAKRSELTSVADKQTVKSDKAVSGATKGTNKEKSLLVASSPSKGSSAPEPSLGRAEQAPREAKRDMALLILPDRQADSVSVETAGTVRQVYGKNTGNEVIVTQRTGGFAASAAASATSRVASASINRITKNINGFEVTVEGKQSQAELEKMADSLVPASSTEPTTEPK